MPIQVAEGGDDEADEMMMVTDDDNSADLAQATMELLWV